MQTLENRHVSAAGLKQDIAPQGGSCSSSDESVAMLCAVIVMVTHDAFWLKS